MGKNMSMSDCPKCWETPCRCGYEYRDWSYKAIDDFIQCLKDVKKFKRKHPQSSKLSELEEDLVKQSKSSKNIKKEKCSINKFKTDKEGYVFGARKPRCFSPWMNCAK